MFNVFMEGGPIFMAILTAILAGVFFAAWKAPRWVKEIGAFALAFGLFSTLLGIIQMLGVVQQITEIAMPAFCGGLRVTLIPAVYGLLIFMISLLVWLLGKARI